MNDRSYGSSARRFFCNAGRSDRFRGVHRQRPTAPFHAHAFGFTLIEMMVVLAVIAILALLAVPSQVDRVVRQQVVDALPLADIAKTPAALAWKAAASFPADNAAAGLPVPEKIVSNWVSGMALVDGAIHLNFGNRAHGALAGKVLSLRPAVVSDAPVVPVTWVCGLASAPDGMTVQGSNLTTIEAKYLPPSCR